MASQPHRREIGGARPSSGELRALLGALEATPREFAEAAAHAYRVTPDADGFAGLTSQQARDLTMAATLRADIWERAA